MTIFTNIIAYEMTVIFTIAYVSPALILLVNVNNIDPYTGCLWLQMITQKAMYEI